MKFTKKLKKCRAIHSFLNHHGIAPQFQITAHNWRAILYACILVSFKFRDDKGNEDENCDYVDQIGLYNLQQTNHFENLILNMLQFDCFVEKNVQQERHGSFSSP